MNRATDLKKYVFSMFYIFIIVIYPLIYELYRDYGQAADRNKVVLFVLLSAIMLSFYKMIINYKKGIIDYLFSLQLVYLIFSITIYSIIVGMYVGDILREILYSIIPILFYFIAKTFNRDDIKIFIKTMVFSLYFVILIGLLNLFEIKFPEMLDYALNKNRSLNFRSYYSAIGMGYISQLMFSILLFNQISLKKYRTLLMLILFITSLLTLQRSAYLGLMISITIYLFWKRGGKNVITILSLSFMALIFYVFLTVDLREYFNYDVGINISEEISNFNYNSVARDRNAQAQIFNTDNIFNIMFGEGFGKYSPNNSLTILKMPDASFYRIYNELGLIGSLVFFTPYFLLLKNAFIKHNQFAIYFIGFTMLAFFFNRIVWMIPPNYIFYTFLGVLDNEEYKHYMKQI
jgi:hypothetical protein